MPKVRLSSGTIGTMRWPISLSRSSVVRMRTKAMVVEISRPSAVAFSSASKAESGGISQRRGRAPARRQRAAERGAARAQIFHLRAVFGQACRNGTLVELVVGDGNVEAVAERLQRAVADLLGLMGDHLPLAGRAHAVALDGLGEDHGRLALVVDRRLVGGVDLERIVAAARQRPDLVVASSRRPSPRSRDSGRRNSCGCRRRPST